MPSLLAGMPSSNILFRNLSKPAIWSSFAGPYWRMMSRLSIFVSIADLAMAMDCGLMHLGRRVHQSLRRVSKDDSTPRNVAESSVQLTRQSRVQWTSLFLSHLLIQCENLPKSRRQSTPCANTDAGTAMFRNRAMSQLHQHIRTTNRYHCTARLPHFLNHNWSSAQPSILLTTAVAGQSTVQ